MDCNGFAAYGRPEPAGLTIWLTGLSGAGKTTLAERLTPELACRGHRVESLDGDVVRTHLSKGLGFTREDRDENIRRIAWVAALGTRHGATMLVSAISPYAAGRREAREQIGQFVEVYVKCSLDELIERDPKGLYARALAGEIENFTGVSDPYEAPVRPEIVVETDMESVEQSAAKILEGLERLGHLAPVTDCVAAA
ncbi:MAG: adenylyl-sulfate kinase [Chloroflexi bacterium]|nr:adenylyl-sulfate kinase [Chloroflexota bacterium]